MGILFFCAGSVFIHMGKAWVRFYGWVYRAREPKWFWWEIALDYLCGAGFIAYSFYLIN